MSTKASIAAGEGFHFYDELLLGPDNVCLEIANPKLHRAKKVSPATQLVTVAIPNEVMDEIAIRWIKHRKLQGAVGGPVGTGQQVPARKDLKISPLVSTQTSQLCKIVLRILDSWYCTHKEILAILQLSSTDYMKCRENSSAVELSEEQLDRLSHLLNVHATLRTVFSNPENVKGFMTMPNRNLPFSGRSPLNFIEDGSLRSLEVASRAIMSLQNGTW